MKKKKESWNWEIKVLCKCAVIFAVAVVLAGIIGGKNLWPSEIAHMKSHPVQTAVAIAWFVGTLISGLLLRRSFYSWWSKQPKINRPKNADRPRSANETTL